ncbi:MAG TPA: alpha-ketoglutarate-dependent dioxygenase AlkB [Puia sp.]|jgi:alkylated DNA repair dioxygenase AlkB|nr:alpha-ketoglutarate-dependent dioxygenase AlkB [Puia sp.]
MNLRQRTLPDNVRNFLPFGGEAYLFPDFFSKQESEEYFNYLSNEIKWRQVPIQIFGKQVMQPRLTAFYGDIEKTYCYSGLTLKPNRWTIKLHEIKAKIETVAETSFTSALLNFYRDEKDSMGWHRDNEKELGLHPVIGSVSFGAPRIFQMRNYKNKGIIQSIELTNGSFFLMRGETQHHWEHRLPKTREPKNARLNLTFRVIL